MAGGEPGAPTNESVRSMRAGAEMGKYTHKYIWQTPVVRPTFNAAGQVDGQERNPAISNDFPVVPVRHNPYDDVANIKYQYAQRAAGTNWVVPFESSDAQYVMQKRDDEEKAMFDAWVMQKYDITDPAQNLMLQQIAPELFQRREELINQVQDMSTRYAKLRLRGAKSLDDLKLQWQIETKRIELPQGAVWNPLAWRAQQQNQAANYYTGAIDAGRALEDGLWNNRRYVNGLFSPLQWLTYGNAAHTYNPQNRADIMGGQSASDNFATPYPLDAWRNVWGPPAPYPYVGTNVAHVDPRIQVAGANIQNPAAPANFAQYNQLRPGALGAPGVAAGNAVPPGFNPFVPAAPNAAYPFL